MILSRAALAGLLWAAAAVVLFVVVVFVAPMLATILWGRVTGGGGAAGFVVGDGPLFLVAVVAFAWGFYRSLRRRSRPGSR
jgi:hypothetical protein